MISKGRKDPKLSKIDQEREQELWAMWQQKPTDQNRNQLIELYMPELRRMVFNRFWFALPSRVKSSIEIDDLMNEVAISLVRAIELYDPERGVKFMTYSALRVRGAILDYLRRCDHLSRSHRKSESLFHPENVSVEVRVDSDPEGRPLTLGDIICAGSDCHTIEVEQLDEVESILASLPSDMAAVVSFYHLDGYDMKTTGRILGFSESRVSQINKKAMILMRQILANRDKRESALRGPSG